MDEFGPLLNLSGLSLRDLEYVLAVADQGGFARAAMHCGVAQPSLSAQVKKLEIWLDMTIFERTTRRVLVTPQGQVLINQARRLLAEARTFLAIAEPSQAPFGGSLRLAAISTLGPYLFPRILAELRAGYNNVALILEEGLTSTLVAKLLDGELDAVLLSLPQTHPALITISIFVEPFLLASPSEHRASADNGPSWDALGANERLLLEEGHCLRDQALAACKIVDPNNRHATSLETLKYMVAAGEGCTLVPALAVSPSTAVVYSPLPPGTYSRTIALAWRRSHPRTNDFLQFAEVLVGTTSKFEI